MIPRMALRKLDEPTIDATDPWRNDDLQRRAAGDTLVRLVQGSAGSPVISLKGSWGSGKSIFMKRVAASLELKQIPVATLDAWRGEYLRDPGLALAGALLERVAQERQQKLGLDLRARLEEAAEKFGVAASRLSALLRAVDAQSHGEAPADEPTTRATSVARSILGIQTQQRTALREFRAALAEIRALMFEARKLDPRAKIPLVFMVDELDRCRPEFALGALDRIKQHFDVDGVAFVVATDGETLPAAVLRLRGGGVDAERYLRKFFDFEFHLPDPDPARFVPVLSYQCRISDLIPEQLTLPQLTNEWYTCAQQFVNEPTHRGHDVAELLETFPQIASALKLSLRDQMLAFTAVTAAMRVARPGVELLPAVLVFCLSLRYAAPKLFERLRTGQVRVSQVLAPDALPAELAHTQLARGWLSDTDTGSFVRSIVQSLANPSPRERSAEFQATMDELAKRNMFRAIAPIRRASVRVGRITEPDPDAYLAGALRMAERFGAGA
jgi:hypothetical protein